MILPPSEYSGEQGTWVAGRVVCVRRATLLPKSKGKKGKGKGADQPTEKCEVHLLGGDSTSEVLYVEAWGEAAAAYHTLSPKGRLQKLQNAKVISQRPLYSSSRLSYHLRIVGPIGIKTRVQELQDVQPPWSTLPAHHPFVDISDLRRVTDSLQVCLLGVVMHQPGVVSRTTQWGESQVCNALIRFKSTVIRTAFWRDTAKVMGTFSTGDEVALYQVKVQKISADEWEIRGTEATCIESCPSDLVDALRADTDLAAQPTDILTRGQATDYNAAPAKPSCVGTLASLVVPGQPRELSGVYEVHSVSVLGLNPVLSSENFAMQCCSRCKRQVTDGAGACTSHPDAPVECRWIAKVSFADASGSCEGMLYHEALEPTGLFPDSVASLTPIQITTLGRRMRNVPWSLRIVYKKNDAKNHVEIKIMLPTITGEGVLRAWALPDVPEVHVGQACPFARCADVHFDQGLGATVVKGREITAARIWVRILPSLDNEEIAVPHTATGLRVTRRVQCAADPSDQQTYSLTQAGLCSGVQWLMQAPDQSTWLVLVSKRLADTVFVALGNLDLKGLPLSTLGGYILPTMAKKTGQLLTMLPADTPLKRKALIDDQTPVPPASAQELHQFGDRLQLVAGTP